MITIALDAMGGDHGPGVTVPAALSALEQEPGIRLILVGQRETLAAELKRLNASESDRLSIHHASEVVTMDEPPAEALRRKRDSSMRVAINLVKDGSAHAAVSAGNTGALMATARFVLKTLPGIDRPAIVTTLPTARGHVHVLDLGANVDCTADQLMQFAVMGSIFAERVRGTVRTGWDVASVERTSANNQLVRFGNQLGQALVTEIPDWSNMDVPAMEAWYNSIVTISTDYLAART